MVRAALTLTIGSCLLAGAAGLSAAGAAAAAAPAPCQRGANTILGTRTERLCGATATIRLGDKTLRFLGGECVRVTGPGRALFSVSIHAAKSGFFGLTVMAGRDGGYRNAVIFVRHDGNNYALKSSRLTLAGRRSQGTFTGAGFAVTKRGDVVRAAVSGSFRC